MGSARAASSNATIRTVADRVGVSVASVSRYLNGDPKVSTEMGTRIAAAIAEMDYTPKAAARSLRGQATRQLSLVVEDIGNPAYVEAMRSLQEVAHEHGMRLLVESTYGDVDKELKVVQDLAQRYVDGVVLFSTSFVPRLIKQLRTPAVPIVVVGSVPQDVLVDSVGADARGGAARAAQHLIEQGCRRIGMINGPRGTLPAKSRLQGFREGLAAVSSADDPTADHPTADHPTADDAASGGRTHLTDAPVIHAATFTRESGYEAATTLLDSGTTVDGLLCANDQLAVGALNACLDRGLRVPEDVALVGMDNSRDATICRPQLTSLDLRFADRGRLAGQMLLDRISGNYDGAARRQIIHTDLVVRGSSTRRTGAVAETSEAATNGAKDRTDT